MSIARCAASDPSSDIPHLAGWTCFLSHLSLNDGPLLLGPLRIVLLYSTTTYHFSSLFNVSTKQQQQLVDRTTVARERPFLRGRESSTSWRSTGVELADSHACFSVRRLGGRGLAKIYSYQLWILRLPLSWFLRCQAPKLNRISWGILYERFAFAPWGSRSTRSWARTRVLFVRLRVLLPCIVANTPGSQGQLLGRMIFGGGRL
jgi:hypothetical protein